MKFFSKLKTRNLVIFVFFWGICLGMIVERFVVNGGETKYKRQEYAQLLVLKQRADLAMNEWDSLIDSDAVQSLVIEKNRTLSDEETYNFQQLQALFKDFSNKLMN